MLPKEMSGTSISAWCAVAQLEGQSYNRVASSSLARILPKNCNLRKFVSLSQRLRGWHTWLFESVPRNRVHVETASISLRLVALLSLRRGNILGGIIWKKINVVEIAHITMTGHGFVLTLILMIDQISQMKAMYATVGRKRRMIDQIDNMKQKIDELEYTVKKKSDENETLKEENKSLKQQNEYLKSIFESMSLLESPEIVMRKTGMFSEKEIQAHMRANKKIWEDMEKTVSENAINKDALIADLQDQHQQDCIRINDLTTTVRVLAGLYSALRKNEGMD